MPPFDKASFDSNPFYHEITGSEADSIASTHGVSGAVVNEGDYFIVDGHVYQFGPVDGLGYDPTFTDWVHDERFFNK